jgi:peptidoglycan/xylan/chitin deacetylase (PgdA/CDA1 family)
MRLVSPFLKRVVYPGLAKTGYLQRHAGAAPAVVTYHGILPEGYKGIDPALDGSLVTAASFRRQLHLLRTRYNLISPEQFLLWCESKQSLPPRSVLLTCDDGLKNTLSEMVPILNELELSCLFFVTGASLSEQSSILWYEELYLMFMNAPGELKLDLREFGIDTGVTNPNRKRVNWWDLVKRFSQFDLSTRKTVIEQVRIQLGLTANWNARYLDDPSVRWRFLMLNLSELRQLSESGMCIGAHTRSHPVLSRASEDMTWSEISANRTEIERCLNRQVWALAYPFGDAASVTRRELEMAERAGFTCAFVNFGGGLGARNPLFALPRVHVTGSMRLAEFEAHVSGFHRSFRQRCFGEGHAAVGIG